MRRNTVLTTFAISLPFFFMYFGCHAGNLPGPDSDFDSTDVVHCLPKDSVYSFDALDLEWDPATDGCGNTVSVILKARSLKPVVYKDSTTCKVQSGLWVDSYSGDTIRSVIDIKIDHVVSLPEAYNSGAWSWNHDQWITFYNDTSNIEITSTPSFNDKAEKGIASWAPPIGISSQHYTYTYRSIKKRYHLQATKADNDYLRAFGDTIALVDYDCSEYQ